MEFTGGDPAALSINRAPTKPKIVTTEEQQFMIPRLRFLAAQPQSISPSVTVTTVGEENSDTLNH